MAKLSSVVNYFFFFTNILTAIIVYNQFIFFCFYLLAWYHKTQILSKVIRN